MAEFLDWNYNSISGSVAQLPAAYSSVLRAMALGWHGPFASKEETLKFYADNKDKNPNWKEPTGWLGNLENVVKTPGEVVSGTVGAITDPLGKLNLGGWMIRIGEIVLGIVLIGVGLARLTGVQNVIAKAAKVAIPT